MRRIKNSKGFIKSIVIIIIAVVILGILGIDLRQTLNEGKSHDNLIFVWELVKGFWNNYVKKPMEFVWGTFYNNVWLVFRPKLFDTLERFEFFDFISNE